MIVESNCVLANALTEAKEPVAFLMVMAVFFAGSYLFGWIASRIPVFKWIPLIVLAQHAFKYPKVLISWELPIFYMFWGAIVAYLMYFKKKLTPEDGYSTALAFPSMPSMGIGSSIGGFFGAVFRVIGWIFRYIWVSVKATVYFLCIRLPSQMIRLGYWLKNIIPELGTLRGWIRLFHGLALWVWRLLPFEIRAEFRRGSQGKSVSESFAEEMKSVFEKERARQKKREEEDLKKLFRKAKRFFRDEAKAGRNPFEDEKEAAQGTSSFHENYESRKREQEERARQEREAEGERNRARAQAEHRENERQRQEKKAAEDFRSEHERKTREDRERRQQSYQQNTKQEYKEKSKQESAKPPPPKELNPLSKEYYDKHKADFLSVDWEYNAEEERFLKNSSPYDVLKVSLSSTDKEIKKSYHKLSRYYMAYTHPYNPVEVQNRSVEIMKVVNGAKDKLLKK